MELIQDLESPPLDGKVHRHFPITVRHNNKARRRTLNHVIRDTAKQYVNRGEQNLVCLENAGLDTCHKPGASPAEKCTRPHIEWDLAKVALHTKGPYQLEVQRSYHADGVQGRRARRWCRPRGPRLAEENSAQLARSDVPFPSDHDRTPHGVRTLSSGDDAEVADLYRMGLLYDEGETKNTFDLNSIRRDEPVYTIRSAKRSRRTNGKSLGYDIPQPLDLDLSFADLGDDDAIAQYLNASSATTPSEIAAAHEDVIQHVVSQRSDSGSPPLRVIYELDSLRPSFDVETSQPPGLVDDFLSDYDCFSDSDLDEQSTHQREVRDDGATADTWVMLD